MIGRPALLALLLLGGCAAHGPAVPPAPARPMRVMSLNQCTDQLVLALLPPARIASVTWLSRDPRFSVEVAAARRVGINHGGVEEVVRVRPDLIVTDTFSNPAGRALLARLGLPMIQVEDASTVADIRRNVRQIAAALGEVARGEALIARMETALVPAPATGLRVAAWDRDGMASGPMLKVVLQAAGLTDVATGRGDVETLLAASPDLLVDREAGVRSASLGDNRAQHPLVRRRWGPERRLRIPQASLFCATPAIGRAATALKAQVRALTPAVTPNLLGTQPATTSRPSFPRRRESILADMDERSPAFEAMDPRLRGDDGVNGSSGTIAETLQGDGNKRRST